ncbi:MAG: sigma 54-interacting transcriptional regulator [Opitutaceae bacterium]
MSELLISFLGLDDLDPQGNLNRLGPLCKLVDSKRFQQVWILFDEHTSRAAKELGAPRGRVRRVQVLGRRETSSDPVRFQLCEFPEVKDLLISSTRLEQKLLDIIGENCAGAPSIHLNSRLCSTVGALTLLIGSGKIEGKLVQVQMGVGEGESEPIISELVMPEFCNIDRFNLCSATTQMDESALISACAERVSMVGSDRQYISILRAAYRFSRVDELHMLISGAPGTGKAKLARFIHALCDSRGNAPFVEVDCSLSSNVTAEVLFEGTSSAWAQSGGGLLALRHIDALSNEVQAELWSRMQQTGTTSRRVIGTSFKAVPELVAQGEFRSDLYGLLKGRLELPRLKSRSDVSRLADYFLDAWNLGHGADLKLSPHVKAHLRRHDWPANLVDLKMMVEGAAESANGNVIHQKDLGSGFVEEPKNISFDGELPSLDGQFNLQKHLKDLEAKIVQGALNRTGGNQTAAAELLCIKKGPMRRCIAEYGLRVR